MPFEGLDSREILKQNKKGIVRFKSKYWSGISREANDLVRRLTNPNPEFRITAAEALQHKWFSLQFPGPGETSGFLCPGENAMIPI